jgi:nucleotide-binding universal stress UspA family protein
MTTHVLVPLDGSDKDERALTAASAMAELTESELHLIHVLNPPIATLSHRARTMGVLDAARERQTDMERSLHEWTDRLTANTGRRVTAEVAEGHDVAQVLVERSAGRDVALVVMATRASAGLSRALLGSVADRVMRESPRPVLLVPPRADVTGPYKIAMRRVLVPLDGSPIALAAVDQLLELDQGRALEYVLLEVVPPLKHASQSLQPVADRLRARGISKVRLRVVENAKPATGIQHVAHEEEADVIAMTTRGLSGAKRFVLGSVAEEVVRESDVPVLLFTVNEPGG